MALRKKLLGLTAVLALGLGAGTASAVIVPLDIAGTPSCDGPGAACNFTVTFDLGAFLGAPGAAIQLDSLGWDLTISTVGASWLGEAVISAQDSGGTEIFSLTAGAGDSFPGTMSYSSGGLVDLPSALGFTPLLADGILTVEFYESFDDVPGAVDAFYIDPSVLTLEFSLATAASEPGILMLFGLGLIGVVVARRRSA